ncbi:MAG: hypothetical protein ACRDSE_00105 [Pseudonocardiaceae bacterium]
MVQRLAREELPAVRAAALAWRNGLAGVLAGLLGFSLIKGRTDIAKVAWPWNVAVGVLLLFALLAGAYGAIRLLEAAHGRPRVVARNKVNSRLAADHEEANQARNAMNHGIAASLLCAALLVSAVATTWYGPEKSTPKLRVTVSEETICGSVVRLVGGTLTLKTDDGERFVDLRVATGMRPVDTC